MTCDRRALALGTGTGQVNTVALDKEIDLLMNCDRQRDGITAAHI